MERHQKPDADVTEPRSREGGAQTTDAEARLYRQIFESAAIGIAHLGPDGELLAVNRQFCSIAGRSAQALTGTRLSTLLHPDDRPAWNRIFALTDSGQEARLTLEARLLRSDGETCWIRVSLSPAPVDLDQSGGAFLVADDISTQHGIQRALVADKEWLDLALAAGRLGTWQIDIENATLSGSPTFWELFGMPDSPAVPFEDLRSRVHPQDWEAFCAAAILGLSRDFDSEIRVRQPNRALRWIALRGREETYNDTVLRIGVAADVTERHGATMLKALASKRALVARELGHRLANLFPVLTALVNIVDSTDGDVASYKKQLLSRIRALEFAHLIVSRNGSGVATLRDLVIGQIVPYRDIDGLHIQGPQVLLSDGAAESFSIVVHELTVNSVKHGALGQPEGHLAVNWSFSKSEPTTEVVFEWVETTAAPLEPGERRGFGSSVVGFDGNPLIGHSPRIEFRASGLAYSLRLPLEAIARRGSTPRAGFLRSSS